MVISPAVDLLQKFLEISLMENMDDQPMLLDAKAFLIEYATMFARYDGVDDISESREDYEQYLSKATESKLKLVRHALHLSDSEKDLTESIVLKAHHELISNDFGKPLEEL